ncbi:hypothetical protein [Ensifer sp. LBL]|uniref:hypothetical protein n=1 Tax=Ensifer sp. LBL TaxID=2991056 RepID=UPI003D21FD38
MASLLHPPQPPPAAPAIGLDRRTELQGQPMHLIAQHMNAATRNMDEIGKMPPPPRRRW